jgi:hypothetical protein
LSVETAVRIASCVCGRLEAECLAEPASVSLCNCLDCQRRTGSAFGIAAFFARDAVRVRGESGCFARTSESGDAFSFHFCLHCGTTVYWETGLKPDLVAVAAGAFADPAFPAPSRTHFDQHRHPWLRFSL